MSLCLCGCGQTTALAQKTDPRYGWVRGQPQRFINGHNKRLPDQQRRLYRGYVLAWAPGHPRAHGNYVAEHILIAEAALGRPLTDDVVVHHANALKTDNRNCNLVILENQAEHNAIHLRLMVLRVGGDPWRQRFCHKCGTAKDKDAFYERKRDGRLMPQCKACIAEQGKQRRRAA